MSSSDGRTSGAQRSGRAAPSQAAQDDTQLEFAFQEAVQEGAHRLHRSLPALFATGAVGGLDLSIGVIALLVVEHETGSRVLGALAFTTGFIALSLARSELFTENFFVPVAAVVGRKARIRELLRLWAGTLVTNLAGGWVAMALIMAAMPALHATALGTTQVYVDLGIGWPSFALAMLGGAVITVMTWIERNTTSEGAQVAGVIAASFVLAAVPLNHVIVSSLEMFASLIGGANFGYLEYLRIAGWAALGNTIGGLVLVTLLRLVQVGRVSIERVRDEVAPGDVVPGTVGTRPARAIHDDTAAGSRDDAG